MKITITLFHVFLTVKVFIFCKLTIAILLFISIEHFIDNVNNISKEILSLHIEIGTHISTLILNLNLFFVQQVMQKRL